MGVDVVTHGEFWAIHPSGRCQRQYGTSVACPVVVAVLALLLSSLGAEQRRLLRSPAAIKQVLAESSQRLRGGAFSYLEQGSGALRPHALFAAMRGFRPHASALPPAIDATDCPYFEPHCEEPLYAGAKPMRLNLTLLDSTRPDGRILRTPAWRPHPLEGAKRRDAAAAHAGGRGGGKEDVLQLRFAYSPQLTAWAGFVGVEVSVAPWAREWGGHRERRDCHRDRRRCWR